MTKQKREHQNRPWWWPTQTREYVVDAPIDDVLDALRVRKEHGIISIFNRNRIRVKRTDTGQSYGSGLDSNSRSALLVQLRVSPHEKLPNTTSVLSVALVDQLIYLFPIVPVVLSLTGNMSGFRNLESQLVAIAFVFGVTMLNYGISVRKRQAIFMRIESALSTINTSDKSRKKNLALPKQKGAAEATPFDSDTESASTYAR